MPNKWTNDEVKYLIKNYPKLKMKELLNSLQPHTLASIKVKANRLGIKRVILDYRDKRYCVTNNIISHLTNESKSYLAGIIDGEGCITFYNRKRGNNIFYGISIIVSNTNKHLIEELNKLIKIGNRPVVPKFNGKNRKSIYKWSSSGSRINTILLRELCDYLLVKKPQALLLKNGYKYMSREEKDLLVILFRKINKRGFDIENKINYTLLLQKIKENAGDTKNIKYNVTSKELSYLAGIIDGEGSIMLARTKGKNHTYYTPIISVHSTCPKLIEFINKIYKGTINLRTKFKSNNCKPAFSWNIGGTFKCAKILKILLPYLRIKKRHAEILLEYSRKLPWGKKNSLYNEIKQLNKRGLYNNVCKTIAIS